MMEGPPVSKPVYIYYKLFDEKGPLKIREPIYFNNAYIGRVDANNIAPPHNVSSLVEHISAKERRGTHWEYGDPRSSELFEKISSPKAFDPQEPLSLSTNRLGSRPQDPLILKIVFADFLSPT